MSQNQGGPATTEPPIFLFINWLWAPFEQLHTLVQAACGTAPVRVDFDHQQLQDKTAERPTEVQLADVIITVVGRQCGGSVDNWEPRVKFIGIDNRYDKWFPVRRLAEHLAGTFHRAKLYQMVTTGNNVNLTLLWSPAEDFRCSGTDCDGKLQVCTDTHFVCTGCGNTVPRCTKCNVPMRRASDSYVCQVCGSTAEWVSD